MPVTSSRSVPARSSSDGLDSRSPTSARLAARQQAGSARSGRWQWAFWRPDCCLRWQQCSLRRIHPVAAMAALLIVSLVTYAGDWKAGIAAIITSIAVLARWMASDETQRIIPGQPEDRAILVLIGVGGLILSLVVERLKIEGSIERQEALAARSAATALSAVKRSPRPSRTSTHRRGPNCHDAIVRSVVGVNRAHVGAP